MFHIILYQPEIPPNTGNIIRLSANCGAQLHLIKPLGFDLSDRHLRRAGLDYHEWARLIVHDNLTDCLAPLKKQRIFVATTKGSQYYDKIDYMPGDAFLFGSETRGLSANIMDNFPLEQHIRIPMLPTSRSLNLSNAVAVVVYEAWRQVDFTNSI